MIIDLKECLLKLEFHQYPKNLLFGGYDEQRNETDKKCYSMIKIKLPYLHEDYPKKMVSQQRIKQVE